MLSRQVLFVLAVSQAAIVALLFGLLIWHRIVRALRQRYRERKATQLASALRDWLAEGGPETGVRRALRACTVSAGREALDRIWPRTSRRERDRVRALLSRHPWLRRVRRACGSSLWWKRMESAQILSYLGDESDEEILRRLLRDRVPAVRLAAIFAARERRPVGLLDDLMAEAVRAQPARAKALEDCLVEYGPAVVPALDRHLQDRRLGTAERANLLRLAEHLAEEAPSPELARCVRPFAEDPQLEVRVKAVRALGPLPGEECEQALLRALQDPSWEVRAQAAKGLGRRGSVAAAPALRRALSDRQWWVRLRAGVALRQLGAAGRRELEAVEDSGDEFARDMARYVLHLEDDAVREYAP